jgi:alpha/beta superfamily hydrolase
MTVREEIDLFGGPEHLYGCRHMPPTPVSAGVVICTSPLDSAVDEGRAIRVGRRLARAGVAVQRFHYHGDPPSDGDPSTVGFASLIDDARQALELLRHHCRPERLGFVGARLGALVAAQLAQAQDGAPLALWEPVLDPGSVLEQAARARRSPPAAEATSDVFDSPLAGDLLDGVLVGGLVDELGARPRPVLVVQTSPGDVLRPGYVQLVARCHDREMLVDVECHPCDGERRGVPVPVAPCDALVERTASWLVARLGAPDGMPSG